MDSPRVIRKGDWNPMLGSHPDEPEDPDQIDDGGLSTGEHVPERGLRSPVVKRDKDTRGPGR